MAKEALKPMEEETPVTDEAADLADFEAAFAGTDDTVTQKAEEPEAEATQEPPEEPEKAEEPEETPAEKAENDRLAKLEARLRAVEGRNGTLIAQNRQLQDRMTKLTEKAPEKAPTLTEMLAATVAGGEKLKGLQADYPEFADALTEQSQLFAQATEKYMGQLQQQVPRDVVSAAQAQELAAEARQLAQIDLKYPEWEESVKSTQFSEWFSQQDAEIQTLSKSKRARDALKLLDKYNEFLTPPKKEPSVKSENGKGRLERALPATSGANRSATRQPSEEEEFLAAFNAR